MLHQVNCHLKMEKGFKKVRKTNEHKAVDKTEMKAHNLSIAKAVEANKTSGKEGEIFCQKIKMRQKVPLRHGCWMIFPNRKHGNRKDGYGCPSLSPMVMGPVEHGQPGVPVSLNIENYHQFNKCFDFEVNKLTNKIDQEFFDTRDHAYGDSVPHRHKVRNKIPLFSVHLDATAGIKRYAYVESRFFYCHWYEKIALQQPAFKLLKKQLESGYNLCICGYDAHDPKPDMYEVYCDASKPFGHEMVLYCLLKKTYPWRRYYDEHRKLYAPLSFSLKIKK